MIILSTAIADDTIGWIVSALVAGLASGDGVETVTIVRKVLLTGAFVLVAFTLGKNFVRQAVRLSNRLKAPYSPVLDGLEPEGRPSTGRQRLRN